MMKKITYTLYTAATDDEGLTEERVIYSSSDRNIMRAILEGLSSRRPHSLEDPTRHIMIHVETIEDCEGSIGDLMRERRHGTLQ